MFKFKSFVAAAAVAASMALGATAVSATPINGTLTLAGTGGQFTATGGANVSTYTGVSFAPSSNTFNTTASTGDLAIFTGTSGTIQDFTYVPSVTPASSFVIISGLNTLTFDLASVDAIGNGWTGSGTNGFLNLTLKGVLTVNGGEATDAIILFSGTQTSPTVTSWSGTLIAEGKPIRTPEPATLALIGAGLAGMGMMRRRKKA